MGFLMGWISTWCGSERVVTGGDGAGPLVGERDTEVVEDGRRTVVVPSVDLFDRVVLTAHMLDLFLAAVKRGVGHRMAAEAIGLHLEKVRPLA